MKARYFQWIGHVAKMILIDVRKVQTLYLAMYMYTEVMIVKIQPFKSVVIIVQMGSKWSVNVVAPFPCLKHWCHAHIVKEGKMWLNTCGIMHWFLTCSVRGGKSCHFGITRSLNIWKEINWWLAWAVNWGNIGIVMSQNIWMHIRYLVDPEARQAGQW